MEIIAELGVLERRAGAPNNLKGEQIRALRSMSEPDFLRYVDQHLGGERRTIAGIRAAVVDVSPLRGDEHEASAIVGNHAFHHRPALGVIRLAQEHATCEVHLRCGGKMARVWDPSTQTGSMLAAFLVVPRKRGPVVTVRARGEGAAALVERIAEHIKTYRDAEVYRRGR